MSDPRTLEALTPGASNPADTERAERHRARLENIDPQGMLTPRERERILEAETLEAETEAALTPQPDDDLQTKLALARQRYAEASDLTYRFADCVECGRRLTYAGPAGGFDRTTARCPRHAENQADTDPDAASGTRPPNPFI